MVIPKEIRRTQRIRQGDALEIYTAEEGQVVFKKYSPLVGLGQLSEVYAEVLSKSLGKPIAVCDRDSVVAAAGAAKNEVLGRQLSAESEKLLAMRALYVAPEGEARRVRAFERGERQLLCAAPIIAHGDIEGGVCLVGTAKDAPPDEETARAINIAASFLARWMEE